MLLIHVPLNVNSAVTAHVRLGPGYFHDVSHVIRGSLPEAFRLSVAARIVLLRHQHVHGAAARQQSDGLTVGETLLPARNVLLAVLAELQIARQVDDLSVTFTCLPGRGFPLTAAPTVVAVQVFSGFSPNSPIGF